MSEYASGGSMNLKVPNLPCGVESYFLNKPFRLLKLFLIYRVELKASLPSLQ